MIGGGAVGCTARPAGVSVLDTGKGLPGEVQHAQAYLNFR